ncbi:MAG: hypothetical protein H0T47_09520 [Planctomycetaceae bacterium]|nr:hypothetical protein [Planctomycetaceae bacterium]
MGSNEASSPARYLRDCLTGRFIGEYLGAVGAGSSELSVGVKSDRFRHHFIFDPDRSYMLTGASTTDVKTNRRLYQVRVLEAKECSGSRWLPIRAVKVQNPEAAGSFIAFEMAVQEYDAEYHAPDSDFELSIPPDTQINVPAQMAWTRTDKEQAEQFGPADLKALHERCVSHGEQYLERQKAAAKAAAESQPPNTPVTAKAFFLWVNLAALAVAAAGIIVYATWWRRR